MAFKIPFLMNPVKVESENQAAFRKVLNEDFPNLDVDELLQDSRKMNADNPNWGISTLYYHRKEKDGTVKLYESDSFR